MSNVAEKIIHKFGGAYRLAQVLKVDVSRVYRWSYPKTRGGTNGRIPSSHQEKILKAARKLGISMDGRDFFADGDAR